MKPWSWGRNELEGAWAELQMRRWKADPELFFRECLWIPSQEAHATNGRVRFDLFDYQSEDLETFLTNRFVIVLKGRQLGLSTLLGGMALHRCLFYPGTVVLWVSNNETNAKKAVKTLDVMRKFMPEWVQDYLPELTSRATGAPEWTFPDGMTSRIRTYAGTATATASETATIVILDEFALVDGHLQPRLLSSADPTTDAGGALWIVSTARGGHNQFAVTFNKAHRGESRFEWIFHPWMMSRFINPLAEKMPGCPECGGAGLVITTETGIRQQDYCSTCVDTTVYNAKAREFDDRPWLVHAEYPATIDEAFRESGNPVFTGLPLEEDCETAWVRGAMVDDEDTGQTFVEDPAGALRVHAEVLARGGPRSWKNYAMFVDPSEGTGGDYIAAQVVTWDEDQIPVVVAWWHANDIPAVQAARELGLLGTWFDHALLAIETTGGFGASMISELSIHQGYHNLYSHTPADARRRKLGSKTGFPMSYTRRPLVIERLIDFMAPERMVGNLYPEVRNEMASFVRNEKGRLEADVGQHDDLVMSLAGAVWVLTEETLPAEKPKHALPEAERSPNRLKAIYKKVEQARAAEEVKLAEEQRMMDRREARRQRFDSRRSRRRARR